MDSVIVADVKLLGGLAPPLDGVDLAPPLDGADVVISAFTVFRDDSSRCPSAASSFMAFMAFRTSFCGTPVMFFTASRDSTEQTEEEILSRQN